MSPENAQDRELCALCRERELDRAENEASHLCADCRAEAIRMRTPRWVEILVVLICVLAAHAVRQAPPALSDARAKDRGDAHFAAREYRYAYLQYEPLLMKYPSALELAAETVDAAIKAQWFGDAYTVLEEHLVEKTLSDELYQKLNPDAQFLFRFANTYSAIAEGVGGIPQDENADPVETRLRYAALLNGLLEEPDAEKAMLYYNLAMTQPDRAEYERYMRLASEAEPRVTYPLADLGNARRTSGHFEEARSLYARALECNALDAGAMRGQSILLLIEGKKEDALPLIREAYSLDSLAQWMPEALYVVLRENGLAEEAATIRQIAEEGGYAFDLDGEIARYESGEIDVARMYLDPEVESL